MGHVDIYHSRRANYTECEYWIRDERDAIGTAEEWILKNHSQGTFWARPTTPTSNQINEINNVWMIDKNTRTIQTDDDIPDIGRGCLVRYRGQLYMVESVQREIHLKESEFNEEEEYRYFIFMRR